VRVKKLIQRARDRFLALPKAQAVPSAVLIGLGAIREAFKLWDEAEFAWTKIQEYAALRFFTSSRVLIGAGVLWLVYLLIRQPEELTERDIYVRQLRKLMKGAVAKLRTTPKRVPRTTEEATEVAWPYMQARDFMRRAFNVHVYDDFTSVESRESDRWRAAKGHLIIAHYLADYLERLEASLKTEDVDFGFPLPDNYDQFHDANDWPANKRPIEL
jgi:hypothetical protein